MSGSYKRIRGIFTLRSPLSHIGEAISTQTFLVEEPVVQSNGEIEQVFAYNGNAWRGALRDHASAYFFDRLEEATGQPAVPPIDIFYLFFTGGRIGGTQMIDIAQARRLRAAVPVFSIFGGGVGNQILAGKMRVSSAYPLCREAIPTLPERWHEEASKLSYSDLTFEKSFTRTDDSKRVDLARYLPPAQSEGLGLLEGKLEKRKTKSGGEVSDQMRMTSELVAAGTRLYQEIDVLDASDVELGALVSAIHNWSLSPHLGGQANKGHGKCTLRYQILDLITGQEIDFVKVDGDGQCLLSPPAAEAKDAYDQHLRLLYDAMIADHSASLRSLIGTV